MSFSIPGKQLRVNSTPLDRLDLNTYVVGDVLTNINSEKVLVNKEYVDQLLNGLSPKESVRVATTSTDGNVNVGTGGLISIDGVTVADGDRVLVKNQSNAVENGVYIAGTGAWSRSADFDGNPVDTGEIQTGDYLFVVEGTENGGLGFVVISSGTNNGPAGLEHTVGTDPINFTIVGSSVSYSGGNGIEITGSALNVDLVVNGGLEFNGGEIQANPIQILNLAPGTLFGDGITYGSNILSVDLLSNGGLEFTSGEMRIALDGINDTMIDFGSSANQINATTLPLNTGGTYTGTATNVQDAIEELEQLIGGANLSNGSGTTISGNSVNLGGDITADTTIGGAFAFRLGNTGNNLSSITLDATNNILVRSNNGTLSLIGSTVTATSTSNYSISSNTGNIVLNSSTGVINLNALNGINVTDTNSVGSKVGIQYAADYTSDAGATSLTLATKGYVDGAVSGVTISLANGNGTTIDGNKVDLGGSMDGGITIVDPNNQETFQIGSTTQAPASTLLYAVDLVQLEARGVNGDINILAPDDISINSSGGGIISISAGTLNITSSGSTIYTDSNSVGSHTGIQYAADYTSDAGATSLTLATKGYVDNEISGVAGVNFINGSGTTYVDAASDQIDLGGALTQNTSITGNFALNLGTTGSRLASLGLESNGNLSVNSNAGTLNASGNTINITAANNPSTVSPITIDGTTILLQTTDATAGFINLVSSRNLFMEFGNALTINDTKAVGSKTGIQYASDYTSDAGATALTLATKGYVDTAVTGVSLSNGSGTTYSSGSPGQVDLGGTLTSNTTIDGAFSLNLGSGGTALSGWAAQVTGSIFFETTTGPLSLSAGGTAAITSVAGTTVSSEAGINLSIGSSGSGTLLINDQKATNSKTGIQYLEDYTSDAGATALTLATKGYVDGAVSSVSFTLQNGSGTTFVSGSPGQVNLGGILSQPTNILAANNSLNLGTTSSRVDALGMAFDSLTMNFDSSNATVVYGSGAITHTLSGNFGITTTSDILMSADSFTYTDSNGVGIRTGIQYAADYTSDAGATSLTLATKGYVDSAVAAVGGITREERTTMPSAADIFTRNLYVTPTTGNSINADIPAPTGTVIGGSETIFYPITATATTFQNISSNMTYIPTLESGKSYALSLFIQRVSPLLIAASAYEIPVISADSISISTDSFGFVGQHIQNEVLNITINNLVGTPGTHDVEIFTSATTGTINTATDTPAVTGTSADSLRIPIGSSNRYVVARVTLRDSNGNAGATPLDSAEIDTSVVQHIFVDGTATNSGGFLSGPSTGGFQTTAFDGGGANTPTYSVVTETVDGVSRSVQRWVNGATSTATIRFNQDGFGDFDTYVDMWHRNPSATVRWQVFSGVWDGSFGSSNFSTGATNFERLTQLYTSTSFTGAFYISGRTAASTYDVVPNNIVVLATT